MGFEVLNKVQSSTFKFQKPFNAEIAKIVLGNEEILLVKPQTFMNNSGEAVRKLIKSYELRVTRDLIVIHDDIALDLGKIKISVGGSSGNHKGVQSVIDHLGTPEFIRVRLGIGRGEGVLNDVVLSKFKPDERPLVDQMVARAAEAITMLVTDGIDKAMNRFN